MPRLLLCAALAAALSLFGCYETPRPECAFQCGDDDSACPEGYFCATDNWCKRQDIADDFVCEVGAPDAAVDAAVVDAADAAAADAAADGGADGAVDAAIDAAVDAAPDAMVDAMPDAAPDAMPDAAPDAMPDAEPDPS